MSTLKTVWSAQLTPGEALMLEYPYGTQLVLTQVVITGGSPVDPRAILKASVETLLMDRPQVDGDFQSIQQDVVLASFAPNEYPIKQLSLVFSTVNICFLQAAGAPLTVSGYIEKSALELVKLAPS
jgi:hypothetical protein